MVHNYEKGFIMLKKIASYSLAIILLLGLITTAQPINPVGNSIAGAAIAVGS